jgi:hypothetical protein
VEQKVSDQEESPKGWGRICTLALSGREKEIWPGFPKGAQQPVCVGPTVDGMSDPAFRTGFEATNATTHVTCQVTTEEVLADGGPGLMAGEDMDEQSSWRSGWDCAIRAARHRAEVSI